MDWPPLRLETGVRMEKTVNKLLPTQMDMQELRLLKPRLGEELQQDSWAFQGSD